MPPRDRRGAQLALEVGPELLQRLKAEAARQERPLAALVRRWLEAGLNGALEAGTAAPAAGPSYGELLSRVEALEAAVLRRPASPNRVIPPPPERVSSTPRTAEAVPLDPLPERRLTVAEAEGLLTLPQVADALGLASGSAITNWIARQRDKTGRVPVGGVYRGFRLRGMGQLPYAHGPGWLWEPFED